MPDSENSASGFNGIDLLVISPVQDTAEKVQAMLRDSGLNVHVRWLNKPENLAEEVQRGLPRLICCHDESDRHNLNRLIGLCQNVARGIPITVITDKYTSKRTTELLQAGASQVVSLDTPIPATRALQREIELTGLRNEVEDKQRRIRQLEKRLGVIVAESSEALAYVHDGIHTQLNQAYATLFGFNEPDELEGVPLMDLVAPAERAAIKALLTAAQKGRNMAEPVPFVAQRADESHTSLTLQCRSANLEGERQIEVRVASAAPPTTAPPPTSAFEGRLSLYQTISDPQALGLKQQSVGLLFVSIDEISKLQDRLGLIAADRVLNELSIFLLDYVEGDDRCFRFDVGEFVVLKTAASAAEIETAAHKLRTVIDAEIFGDENSSSPLSASIAVTQLGEKEANNGNLLRAMRLAHRTSLGQGNSVVKLSADEQQLPSGESDRLWLERVKTSLEHNGFDLALRSIASLEGDPNPLYDICLRMRGDQGEQIHPDEFLPTAQRHGLMPTIDQWVVQRALATAAQNPSHNKPATMFIKLARESIESSDVFLSWLQKQLAQTQVKASDLVLAFDQESLQVSVKKAATMAEALHALGIKLAIHQFSADTKSLKLLDMVNADYVKLDAELTAALVAVEEDSDLLKNIHAAQQKNVKIIAAAVEDANSMARLWQSGVNYVQGQFVEASDASAPDVDIRMAKRV